MPEKDYVANEDNLTWDIIYASKTITKKVGISRGTQRKPARSNKRTRPSNDVPAPQILSETRSVLTCTEPAYGQMHDGFISFPHDRGASVTLERILAVEGVSVPEFAFAKYCSGEALLGAKERRPLLVIVVFAVDAETGSPVECIRPAVSSPFRVATPRTKGKSYTPVDDESVRL